jgi:hypothetical protein
VLDASKPADRLVTDYAAYFEDPHAEILRLLEFAELDVSAASRDACAAFIAERLRHHRLTNVHLAAAELAPDLVEVYRRLLVEAGRQQEAQRLADTPKPVEGPSIWSQHVPTGGRPSGASIAGDGSAARAQRSASLTGRERRGHCRAGCRSREPG